MEVLNPFAPPDVPSAKLTVLVWNEHWFGDRFEQPLTVTTPHGARIELAFTRNRRHAKTADAVWLHLPTAFGLPRKRPGQPWVLASMEADANHRRQAAPESYRLFELRMTHRLDSDVPTPYATGWEYGGFQPAPRPPQQPGALACFIASNPVPWRDNYVRDLMRYMPVDCYGACLNNRSFADLAPSGSSRVEEVMAAIAAYPFYLAFENCRELGYVTEKLFRPLSVGTVPVYWGAPDAADYIPGPEAIIEVDDGLSPAALATLLQETAADPQRMARHLAWQSALSPAFRRLIDLGDVNPRARLATKLAHGCDHDCGCGGRQRF